MKRLIKTVDLVFFRDDATGEFGLAHKETYENNEGSGFNAFWDGMGIFHDVFEHSHELTHKYFKGDYAMNIGGEMAAMGSMMYYIDTMGLGNRLRAGNWRGHGEIMRESTFGEVHEAISSGWCQFGYTLESNVPKQRPTDNGELEYQVEEYYKKVQALQVETEYEQEREFALNYKQSVTFRKIADLHRYGYRMAEKLVPNKWDNRATLAGFIDFWNNFTKENPAEEMNNNFDGLTIKLYKDENGFVTWSGVFSSRYPSEIQDAKVNENTRFSIEDYWIIEDEN